MTTQCGDRLIDNGKKFWVKPFPLYQLGDQWCTVKIGGTEKRRFAVDCTANWKGYYATWTIENERLYLTAFSALDLAHNKLTIEDVFGTSRLFAFWYTGDILASMGKHLYGMFNPTYEQNQIWRLEHGVVKERFIRTNDTPGDFEKAANFVNWTDQL
jgi:hypothetical protein